MRQLYRSLGLAALVFGLACARDASGPGEPAEAGTLSLRLSTPHADDGAVLFEVSGPPIDTLLAASGSLRVFMRRADGSTVIGAVVGVVAEGPVVTLRVPDVGAAARYTARIREVADRDAALRASLTGYALTVGP
jgi:hypothetical protein